ncbi:histidine kinase [Clostridium carnis]
MNKEETILQILCSIFALSIFLWNSSYSNNDIIICIIFTMIFISIELISFFIKKYKYPLRIFQILIFGLSVYFDKYYFIILVPSTIYMLISKRNRMMVYFIFILITCKFIKFEYIAIFISYSIIIYLYMDVLNKKRQAEEELKSSYRIEREERHKLSQKLVYIDRYRNHNDVIEKLKDRNYIAQKLHDKIGHSVTSSIMQLEVTKAMIDKDREISLKYLNSAIKNLRLGIDDIRLVLRDIKPKDEIIGIENIKSLLYEFGSNTGIKNKLETTGDLSSINNEVWMVIEDNLREALTNICRYSKATEVEVIIEVYNKFIRADIRDNGVGVEVLKKGIGLRGMEERVKSIGGTIRFIGSNGFIISMIIGV